MVPVRPSAYFDNNLEELAFRRLTLMDMVTTSASFARLLMSCVYSFRRESSGSGLCEYPSTTPNGTYHPNTSSVGIRQQPCQSFSQLGHSSTSFDW